MVITGVIRPPPDIRVVADRTASYVAKNGRAFESRILKSEKGKTPKFAFLQPTSPFHAYYEDRIKFYEDGEEDGGEEKTATQDGTEKVLPEATLKNDPVRKKEKKQKASAIDPVARALLSQRARITKAKAKQKEETEKIVADDSAKEPTSMASLPPPSPLELVNIVAPSSLSAAQIEAIQLVAHFAALDGKGGSFLHQLTVREWNNSEFSFCQPRHAHFAYFSALVDAYRKILGAWTSSPSSNTPEGVNSIQQALDEVSYRAEYEREIEQQKLQQEEGEVLAIDWHDFVVVETIDFPVDEVVELSMLPPPPPPPTTADTQMLASQSNHAAQDYEYEEEEDETIRVVPSYTPKVVGPRRPQEARAIDPITGKSVSVADVPEHLRIQLLDPKWAEERKKFQEKQKDSNLVGDDAIVSNISRFARGDLYKKSVSITRPCLVGLVESFYLN
jgi:splicing factor 3A subunit 1